MPLAFKWASRTEDSIFMERQFTGYATGKTHSQMATDNAAAFQNKHGRSLGTVPGLSDAADKRAEIVSYGRGAYPAKLKERA